MADDFYDLPMHSGLRNYIIPGLTSRLVGDWSDPTKERLRIFHMETPQMMAIVPHSHRYDFHCKVLEGLVTNRLYLETTQEYGIPLHASELEYSGSPGNYQKSPLGLRYYSVASTMYAPGMTYSMRAEEIHDIFFSMGAQVMFWEGPQRRTNTVVLEPMVPGVGVIPLLKTEEWMFQKIEDTAP